jgi:hypothetical protein
MISSLAGFLLTTTYACAHHLPCDHHHNFSLPLCTVAKPPALLAGLRQVSVFYLFLTANS